MDLHTKNLEKIKTKPEATKVKTVVPDPVEISDKIKLTKMQTN